MKRKNMLLAGILSAAMVMSGGGAIAAYAEETGSEAVVTENKDAAENADAAATDTDTAEEGADTTAENGDAAAEKAESADEKTEETEKQADANNSGSTQPPAFRMRDRLMQPPQSMPGSRNDAGAPTDGQKPEEEQLQGKDGAKEAFRRFMPGRMPENRPDGQNGAQDDRMRPWGVGNMDPFRGPQGPANSQMPQENNGQAPQENNGQMPQENNSQAPQENNGQMPQENNGQAPQENNGQMPQENSGQMPQENNGQAPQENSGQMPQENNGQAPQENNGQMPQDGSGQAPQAPGSQMPQSGSGQMPQGSAPSGNMPAPQGGPNA